jgi:hypothetical protein
MHPSSFPNKHGHAARISLAGNEVGQVAKEEAIQAERFKMCQSTESLIS